MDTIGESDFLRRKHIILILYKFKVERAFWKFISINFEMDSRRDFIKYTRYIFDL